MSKNEKILFISTTLGGGGAERIISYLLNEFAQDYDKKYFFYYSEIQITHIWNMSPLQLK